MKIGIYGSGNLGRGVEAATKIHSDSELVAIFTRRPPESVKPMLEGVKVYPASQIFDFCGKLDVLILCGGSATDLPEMTPMLAKHFNVVDSFDNHSKIPYHFDAVDKAAKEGGKVAMISVGWDPGLFSLARAYLNAALPSGKDYTFWGRGISQGHSDAIRRIDGVLDARQYTVPVEEALESVRSGKCPELTTREKHRRECYVVLKEGASQAEVEEKIKTMPGYFADYDTYVNFITLEQLRENHKGMPHGGSVIRSGVTGFNLENSQTVEFSLKLDSNPEFTASVLVAYARAVYRLNKENNFGCKTVFDIAPSYLNIKSHEELISTML